MKGENAQLNFPSFTKHFFLRVDNPTDLNFWQILIYLNFSKWITSVPDTYLDFKIDSVIMLSMNHVQNSCKKIF